MSGVNRPELLSPAGSMESLKAAVNGLSGWQAVQRKAVCGEF